MYGAEGAERLSVYHFLGHEARRARFMKLSLMTWLANPGTWGKKEHDTEV